MSARGPRTSALRSTLVRTWLRRAAACLLIPSLAGCWGSGEPQGKPITAPSEVEDQGDVLQSALEDVQHPEGKNRMLKRKAIEELRRDALRAAEAARKSGQGRSDREYIPFEEGYIDVANPNKEILEFRNPETLKQVVDNLNQWLATRKPPADWKPDPLVSTLPEELARDGVVYSQLSQLAKPHFQRDRTVVVLDDGWYLQEAVWLRDLSNRIARGEKGQLAVAAKLFDWTVRNLDLIPGEPDETVESNGRRFVKQAPLVPWQALLYGKGQRITRAWVFVLLARQQGIDAVLLEAPKPNSFERETWAVAALVDGELRLFDPELGAPIPSKDGKGIATLKEVLASPGMLAESLSTPKFPYRFADLDFAGTVAAAEGTGQGLSLRMAMLQKELTGRNRFEAAASPSAVAERIKAAGAERTVLWAHPYRLLRQVSLGLGPQAVAALEQELRTFLSPTAELWTARVFHLKGLYTVEQAEEADETPPHVRPVNQKAAIQYYFDLRVMFADAAKKLRDAKLTPQQQLQVAPLLPVMERAKQDADYWLALLNLGRGKVEVAQRGLKIDVLRDEPPSPWREPARYNLGRIYEDQGKTAEALATYDALSSGPHAPAAAWRAARLRRLSPAAEETNPATETKPAPDAKSETSANAAKPEDAAKGDR